MIIMLKNCCQKKRKKEGKKYLLSILSLQNDSAKRLQRKLKSVSTRKPDYPEAQQKGSESKIEVMKYFSR